jgi:hypothetical protein
MRTRYMHRLDRYTDQMDVLCEEFLILTTEIGCRWWECHERWSVKSEQSQWKGRGAVE